MKEKALIKIIHVWLSNLMNKEIKTESDLKFASTGEFTGKKLSSSSTSCMYVLMKQPLTCAKYINVVAVTWINLFFQEHIFHSRIEDCSVLASCLTNSTGTSFKGIYLCMKWPDSLTSNFWYVCEWPGRLYTPINSFKGMFTHINHYIKLDNSISLLSTSIIQYM